MANTKRHISHARSRGAAGFSGGRYPAGGYSVKEEDILSVGTLKQDPTSFFAQMDNLVASDRLQHTPSMMELPTSAIQDIIREYDEEHAAMYGNKKKLSVYKNYNGAYYHNTQNSNEIKEDSEDDEQYEYYYDETDEANDKNDDIVNNSQSQPETPINGLKTNIDNLNEQQSKSQTASPTINNNHIPRLNKSSNHFIHGLPLTNEDSEEYQNKYNNNQEENIDTTPIVKIIRPPPPPQHVLDKQMNQSATRRRSDGLAKITQEQASTLKKFRPSQKAASQSTLSHVPDEKEEDVEQEVEEEEEEETDYEDDSDDSDDDEDDNKKEMNGYESDKSHTMDLDESNWLNINDENINFTECNIRFEEDDWSTGKKPPASEFMSLRFFFQFIYDRFHLYSQFLLDTSLPMYSEWKKMRKVRLRNASLKTVDYALKACIECVDSIKCLVRNCIILCLDNDQQRKYRFKQCLEPKIASTSFNIGDYSIMAAWDLFDNGSTPSTNDWTIALSQDKGTAQKLSQSLPDLSHLTQEMKAISLAYHNGKTYKFNIICEFLNENEKYFKFGGGPIEWKLIKSKFVNKHGDKYKNNILKAFDQFSYFINPPLNKLSELMNDKNDKFVSKRRIIAEPIMWLFYMVSYLIERQEKLQNLYITAMSFKGDNNNKGQKLNALITDLAKQAKDESERLRATMAKLPTKDDLKKTLIQLVKNRDPQNTMEYTKSLKKYKF